LSIGKITRPGLAGIAVSVALLWGCLIGERCVVQQATIERARALSNIERLRHGRRPQPVSVPGPLLPHRLTTSLG